MKPLPSKIDGRVGTEESDFAYPFLRVGQCPLERPRKTGMTWVIDGMDTDFVPLSHIDALTDFSAPYIDFVKLGWMIPRLCSKRMLVSKIERYHNVGIRVFTGGLAMQAAMLQGKVAEFIEASKSYGVDAMEVGSTVAHISSRAADDALRRVKASGMIAILEIGKKGAAEANPTPDDIRRQLDRLTAAGGDFLIIESERLESMHNAGTLEGFFEGCSEFGLEKPVFELPYGLHFPALQPIASRLFGMLGPEANVANVDFKHVMGIATVRNGTCFGELFGRVSTDEAP